MKRNFLLLSFLVFCIAVFFVGCPGLDSDASRLIVSYTTTSGGSVKIDPPFKSRALVDYNKEILFTSTPEEGYSSAWEITGGTFVEGGKYGDLTAKVKVTADTVVSVFFYKKMEYSQLADYLSTVASVGAVNYIEITSIRSEDLTHDVSIQGSPISLLLRSNMNKKVAFKFPAVVEGLNSMRHTFFRCENLVSVVAIPEGVQDLHSCFSYCFFLSKVPLIPEGVTDLSFSFNTCISLETVDHIPDSVVDMISTFENCTSLTKVFSWGKNTVQMENCFLGCSKLDTIPSSLPQTLVGMDFCFSGCIRLGVAPEIPGKVSSMVGAFGFCASLEEGPSIPESVVNLNSGFMGCGRLKSITLNVPYSSGAPFKLLFELCESLTEGSIRVPNAFLAAYTDPSALANMKIPGKDDAEKSAKFVGF